MTENMKKLLEIVSASNELGVALTEADFVKPASCPMMN